MKSILLCIAITTLLVGCNSNRNSTLDPIHESALLEDQTITVMDRERQYHLYVSSDPDSVGIVLLLHGNGGSNDQVIGLEGTKAPHKVWLDIARRENLILVVPNGVVGPNDKRGWNDCRNDAPTNPDSDDVIFIRELIDFVKVRYGSSASRVFLVGTSNGGHMSMRLADEMPEAIDAMAFVVASRPVNSECMESTTPLSVLIMNGTADPILPYNGGQIGTDRGEVYSTAETVNYWINRNQSDTTPAVIDVPDSDPDDDSTINRYSYSSSANNTVVEHYEVMNGGHTEPSIVERYSNLYKLLVGNQNADIETATEIWAFFESQ